MFLKIWMKSFVKMECARFLSVISLTTFTLFLTLGGSALSEEVELDEAKVFIEWNSTDRDHGIQFFWDSEGFTDMTVTNEQDGELVVETYGNIFDQGLTEVAIESVEPEESEQTRAEFFARFPAGTYEFEGESTDGETITGEAELTHDLLEPVEFTKINLPVIEWDEPELNDVTQQPLAVVGYELVVELVVEIEVNGDTVERVFKEVTNYPAGESKHIVGTRYMKLIKNPPGEVVALKVEILADEPSGNRTITEETVIEEED